MNGPVDPEPLLELEPNAEVELDPNELDPKDDVDPVPLEVPVVLDVDPNELDDESVELFPVPLVPGVLDPPRPVEAIPEADPSPELAIPPSGCPKKVFTVVLFWPTGINRQSGFPVNGST